MAQSKTSEGKLLRCAIYTRKSNQHGLAKPLNSLETQRDVCQSYIRSQAHRNWVLVPSQYDDGGYSGGSLSRPALRRLLDDIEAGRVDIVVIYKVDRLSRSLTDFVRLMDVLDKYGASFVSVTQTFDTSDSMGRLVLNILLTFAQFERELSSERIRDRCALRRSKGLFPGGMPPVGYLVKSKGRLTPDPQRAAEIRQLFLDYQHVSAAELGRRLEAKHFKTYSFGCRTGSRDKQQKFPASNILKILRNPLYAGYFYRDGQLAESQIEPLVSLEQWERVQHIIRTRNVCTRDPIKNFLLGILHDELGRRMTAIKGTGGTKKDRYYVSESAGWARGYGVRKLHVRADEVERLAVSTLQSFFADRALLRETIFSLGVYSSEIASALRRGQLASRRLALMDNDQLREFMLAVVARADVNRTQMRLLVCNYEVLRFLAWDGEGLFKRAHIRPRGSDRFRMLYAPCCLICTKAEHAVPVQPNDSADPHRDRRLIETLRQAAELREFMLSNRSKSIAQLAREKNLGSKHFARLMRLNYLAPDIQAAIMDGSQPAHFNSRTLVFSSLPLDWEQQRRLFGFPSPIP
jgi:DNA invertase Pin-like site-specific DNA recombinase